MSTYNSDHKKFFTKINEQEWTELKQVSAAFNIKQICAVEVCILFWVLLHLQTHRETYVCAHNHTHLQTQKHMCAHTTMRIYKPRNTRAHTKPHALTNPETHVRAHNHTHTPTRSLSVIITGIFQSVCVRSSRCCCFSGRLVHCY